MTSIDTVVAAATKPGTLFGGGFRNLLGAGPGEAFTYREPTMPRTFRVGVPFTSTHESIADMLPAPLQPARDAAPMVNVYWAINRVNRGYDGGDWPYQLFYFGVPAEYNGVRGTYGFEYVDGINGDKTTSADMLIAWGVYYGMLKKLADIRTTVDGNTLTVSVSRQRTTIAELSVDIGAEVPLSHVDVAAVGEFDKMLSIREIPMIDSSGYTQRLVFTRDAQSVSRTKEFAVSNATLSFGSLARDPLDRLEIIELGPPFAGEVEVGVGHFRKITPIADLLTD